VPAERFHAALRFTFYGMLQQYGDRCMIEDADRSRRTTSFVARYVRIVADEYAV
jgi:hypothetical protein